MALVRFVRNLQDLSDDGGFQFRFCCDRCHDGFDSDYVSSKGNLFETAVHAFELFRPLGGSGMAALGLDRGLRGREHAAAYEKAVSQVMVQFKKCAACNQWVCPENCWNERYGMCEDCAPDEREAVARQSARLAVEHAVMRAAQDGGGPASAVTCSVCGQQAHGDRFCEGCGSPLGMRSCPHCGQGLSPGARFCGGCGARTA
jgi:hypothetical protein